MAPSLQPGSRSAILVFMRHRGYIIMMVMLLSSHATAADREETEQEETRLEQIRRLFHSAIGLVCDSAFPVGYVFAGKSAADHERLKSLIWLDGRKRELFPVSPQDAVSRRARCYAVGPHRGLNVKNWCCKKSDPAWIWNFSDLDPNYEQPLPGTWLGKTSQELIAELGEPLSREEREWIYMDRLGDSHRFFKVFHFEDDKVSKAVLQRIAIGCVYWQ
jgi:hypothetical protein